MNENGVCASPSFALSLAVLLVLNLTQPSLSLAGAECLAKFGSAFGGDSMVTHCAALATDQTVQDTLKVEPTLHQLDIRGDGSGFFQAGFLITSLHHWGSWFTLFPPWHELGRGDLRNSVRLVGKAAKAVGGDNWGRRYVFEGGRVVVALGYSVTVWAQPMSLDDLAKSVRPPLSLSLLCFRLSLSSPLTSLPH